MKNSYTLPFSLTTSNMGFSQNSDFSFHDQPMSFNGFTSTPLNSLFDHAQHPYIEYQIDSFAYPVHPVFQGQNGNEFGSCFMQTEDVSMEAERRIPDSHKTKAARIRRKMARQRSQILQRNGSSSSNQVDLKRSLTSFPADISTNVHDTTQKDLYTFFTPNNKRLRVLLRKELKNSDVGTLGRIVLPKKEVELNLPTLTEKEGIHLMLKDLNSIQVWTLKYKFWSNNKSRMYVLENTGEFVKQNGLEIGDSLTLYEDESKDLYYSITKAERVAAEPSRNWYSYNGNGSNSNSNSSNNNDDYHIYMPYTCQARDEEETSLELLIEQLKHKEQQEANNLMMSLPMDTAAYSHKLLPKESSHYLSDNTVTVVASGDIAYSQMSATAFQALSADDIQINNIFDDCYGGLDVLPDFHNFNFSI